MIAIVSLPYYAQHSQSVTQPSVLAGTSSVRNKAQFLPSGSLQSSGTALHRDSWGGKELFSCYALTGVPAALPRGAVGWPA